MMIEDYFSNLGWICIRDFDKSDLSVLLETKIKRSVKWEIGYEMIINSFDEKIFLHFKITNWDFIIGKFYFLEKSMLIDMMNKLSENSKEVNSFAIDGWSNYYCFSKSVNGESVRFFLENDEESIDIGEMITAERHVDEKEIANKILQIANKITVPFDVIERYLARNEVVILDEK